MEGSNGPALGVHHRGVRKERIRKVRPVWVRIWRGTLETWREGVRDTALPTYYT